MLTLREHLKAIRSCLEVGRENAADLHALSALAILDAADVFYPADLSHPGKHYGDQPSVHRMVHDPEDAS